MRPAPLIVALLSCAVTLGIARAEAPATPEELVHRALSVRHEEPTCDVVEAMTPTPVPTLLFLVENASQPPWVPMRAAGCLLRGHHEEIRPQLDQWVTDPKLQGLGILVLTQLDTVPLELSKHLATLALTEGPDEEGTRTRLRRLQTAELRALADVGVTP